MSAHGVKQSRPALQLLQHSEVMSFFGRTEVPVPYPVCSTCLPLFKTFEHHFYGLLQRCGCKEESSITANDRFAALEKAQEQILPTKGAHSCCGHTNKNFDTHTIIEECILQCLGFRFWVTSILHGLRHQMLEREPTREAVVMLLANFFRRKHWKPLLQATADSVGVGSFALARFEMERGMDVFHSVDIAQGIHVGRRR